MKKRSKYAEKIRLKTNGRRVDSRWMWWLSREADAPAKATPVVTVTRDDTNRRLETTAR